MLGSSLVCDMAVILREYAIQELEMVDFVGSEIDQSFEHNEASSQVERWGSRFETSTYTDVRAIDGSTIVSNFTSWTSMHSRNEIDEAEI